MVVAVAVVCKVIFVSNPNKVMLVGVELWLSWGFDKIFKPLLAILDHFDNFEPFESSLAILKQ